MSYGEPFVLGVDLDGVCGAYTEAFRAVEIRPQVTGELKAIHFEDGRNVLKGAPLFEIDKVLYEADVEKARADILKSAADILNWKAQIKRAEAELVRVDREMYVVARQLWSKTHPGKALPPDDEAGRRETVRLVLGLERMQHPQKVRRRSKTLLMHEITYFLPCDKITQIPIL